MFKDLFQILIFPGLTFLVIFSLFAEYFDRKLYARLQNRVGPPWFQPFADILKLLAKEELIPCEANPRMFKLAPLFAFTAAITAFLYIPLWQIKTLFSFNGDVLVVLYLLTIPTLSFFIGGWYSTSLFARIGSVRSMTQLFAYEVPLFMGILSSALLANTWNLKEIALFYSAHPWFWLFNLPGFCIALIALLGKLEKVPFDIPEAETEIVAGSFTEYSGKLFAFLKLTLDIEMVVGAALLAAVFFPFGLQMNPFAGFVLFLLKIIFIVFLLSLLRTVMARLRIDQMIDFCWKYLVPLAFVQILLNLAVKGVILK
ncbi:MAG: NADH-quinone oxidoreductase subunit H [Candidatus Omnitrophica bacterium]|nr:NADH-quinone oxidoreductase subunit H [Candidatus Omnitrophota bacterium]MDD5653672.1 NADH-quinone oxidoreductase subunit H [Candidatus Omnitrophota bacterium]